MKRFALALLTLALGTVPAAAQSSKNYGTLNVFDIYPDQQKMVFNITTNFPYPYGKQNVIGEYSCAKGFSVYPRYDEAFSAKELLDVILKMELAAAIREDGEMLGAFQPLNVDTAYALHCLNDGRVRFSNIGGMSVRGEAGGNIRMVHMTTGQLDVTLPLLSFAQSNSGYQSSETVAFTMTPVTKSGPYKLGSFRGMGSSGNKAVLMLEHGGKMYPIAYAGRTQPHAAIPDLTFGTNVKLWFNLKGDVQTGWTVVDFTWETSPNIDAYFAYNKPRPKLTVAK